MQFLSISVPTKTWEKTAHPIKTLYGILEATFQNNPSNLLFGPGQGSAKGPILWLLCFILIHMSLSKNIPKITLSTATKTETVMFIKEALVDDTGLGTNTTEDKQDLKSIK